MTPENLARGIFTLLPLDDLKLKKELAHLNKHLTRVTKDLEQHLQDKDSKRYKNLDKRYTFE